MESNSKEAQLLVAAILCGGRGLRIRGDFENVPKPLIVIGDKPILGHIVERYRLFGVTKFILLVGDISQPFEDFAATYGNDINIEVVRTGLDTPTGGRVKLAESHLSEFSSFFLTYGDGLANVDFLNQMKFHRNHGNCVTLTAVQPELPFGFLDMAFDCSVTKFEEKPKSDKYVNGGFFIFRREVFEFLEVGTDLEKDLFPRLCDINEIKAYVHNGKWKNIDTYKDYMFLVEEPEWLLNLKN